MLKTARLAAVGVTTLLLVARMAAATPIGPLYPAGGATFPTTITYEQLPRGDMGIGQVSSAWDPLFNELGARVWDNFTLPSDATITEIVWWGFNQYPSSGTPDFSLTLYPDVNGVPGDPLSLTGGSLTVSSSAINGVYTYSYALGASSPFTVQANTKYWISIYNQSTSLLWGWQIAAAPGDGAIQTDYAFDWTSDVPDVAFRVVASTNPETVPDCSSTLALLGLALGGMAGSCRKRPS